MLLTLVKNRILYNHLVAVCVYLYVHVRMCVCAYMCMHVCGLTNDDLAPLELGGGVMDWR